MDPQERREKELLSFHYYYCFTMDSSFQMIKWGAFWDTIILALVFLMLLDISLFIIIVFPLVWGFMICSMIYLFTLNEQKITVDLKFKKLIKSIVIYRKIFFIAFYAILWVIMGISIIMTLSSSSARRMQRYEGLSFFSLISIILISHPFFG